MSGITRITKIVEIYEYDSEGKIIKKTVIEEVTAKDAT